MTTIEENEMTMYPKNLRDFLFAADSLLWSVINYCMVLSCRFLMCCLADCDTKKKETKRYVSRLVCVAFFFLSLMRGSAQTTNPYFKTENGIAYVPVLQIAPTVSGSGALYFNSTTRLLCVSNGSQWIPINANSVPVAVKVGQSGSWYVGSDLRGIYTYKDVDVDDEGISTYKWYRASDAIGTNAVVIADATAKTYTLTESDKGTYIGFEVTPVAKVGETTGIAVRTSTFSGPIQ